MCGILAEFTWNGRPVDRDAFGRMLARLARRGPDHEGLWFEADGRVALGHRRLSIIDLSARGNQPLANETGEIQLVHNGEIYNYPTLRRQLEVLGHRFASMSDSEVIIHAYEEWGDGCLSRLRGIFAFALWDGVRRRLFLARDQLGVKPLYVWRQEGSVVAASEAKALLAHPGFVPRPNLPVLQGYLAWRYIAEGESAFCGLETVPPGHGLVFEGAGGRRFRYWKIEYNPTITDVPAAVAAIRGAATEALALQRVSDVPIGVLLSGGIDSTAVLGGLAEASGGGLPCFTTGFVEAEADERPFARVAAAAQHGPIDEFLMTRDVMMESWAGFAEWHDEPVFDYSAIPIHHMARRAREAGIKVLFAGDGADELFAGYSRYETFAAWAAGWRGKSAYYLGREQHALARLYFDQMGYLGARELRRLMPTVPLRDPVEFVSALFPPGTPAVVAAQLCDLQTFLVSDILTKVDRASMAAGVEVRVPWLDHKFVELAFRISLSANFGNQERKHVFKQAVAHWIPSALNSRRKKGFGFPLDRWLDGPWRERAAQLVARGHLVGLGVFAPEPAMDLVRTGSGEVCWLVLCAEIWARRWLDRQEILPVLIEFGLVDEREAYS